MRIRIDRLSLKKTKSTLILLGIAVIINITSSDIFAEQPRRDGNWWRTIDYNLKLVYMSGFFDGIQLGFRFSFWPLYDEKEHSKPESVSSQIAKGYEEYYSKYLSDVRTDQIADGLDKFYEDFRNRKIWIWDGVWLVLKQIAGTPSKEMEKIIENFRKSPY